MYQYRCYVKDQLQLAIAPKAFMVVDSFDIKQDLLTTANSKVTVMEMADNVNHGDILVVYDPKGKKVYQGVINSIQDNTMNCSQIQSYLKGNWIYNTDTGIYPSTFDNKFTYEQYSISNAPEFPNLSVVESLTPSYTSKQAPEYFSNQFRPNVRGVGVVRGYIWCTKKISIDFGFWTTTTGTLTINGKEIDLEIVTDPEGFQQEKIELQRGMNEWVAVFRQSNTLGYWYGAVPDPSKTLLFARRTKLNSTKDYNYLYLEAEIYNLLKDYCDGKMFESKYIDPLVDTKYANLRFSYEGSNNAHLPTSRTYEVIDMEKWIYSLFRDYQVLVDIQVNFRGMNDVTIYSPSNDTIVFANNISCVQNMTPITKVEETNRLIIYSSEHEYRGTWVALKNESGTTTIVKEPSSTANRFDVVNTKVVYSDDLVTELIAKNLPTNMYNHEISFDLVIDNNVYDMSKVQLGQHIEVWYNGSEHYNSIITGLAFKKGTNENVSVVSVTCGLVRKKLTQLMTLGKA